jgi:hypothetical protein
MMPPGRFDAPENFTPPQAMLRYALCCQRSVAQCATALTRRLPLHGSMMMMLERGAADIASFRVAFSMKRVQKVAGAASPPRHHTAPAPTPKMPCPGTPRAAIFTHDAHESGIDFHFLRPLPFSPSALLLPELPLFDAFSSSSYFFFTFAFDSRGRDALPDVSARHGSSIPAR